MPAFGFFFSPKTFTFFLKNGPQNKWGAPFPPGVGRPNLKTVLRGPGKKRKKKKISMKKKFLNVPPKKNGPEFKKFPPGRAPL